MVIRFAELDWRETPDGEISLRRRFDPTLQAEVYEVKLGEEFLMSSLFTVAEVELANLGLAAVDGADLDIVVGGLGLGYTARAVLSDDRVSSVVVIEAMDAVIDWHRRELVPAASEVVGDSRHRFVRDDFFSMASSGAGFDPDSPGREFDAILLDIDHSPAHLLRPEHADFYTSEGLANLSRHLRPGGVFGMWSNDPPDADFTARLSEVFSFVRADVVAFDNPLQGQEATNTVYIAQNARST